MNTVTVQASQTYDIKIGPGLLGTLPREVALLGGVQRVCIVSDSNVWPIYGRQVQKELEVSRFCVVSYVFPAGEGSKNGQVFLELLDTLARAHLTRTDLIVALGGGVVGDLAGFAASCYLRGIRFVQVPTTLLAAVDSSVGGKTAIDLPSGKNLAGSFYQPSLVLCDTNTLKTLPQAVFRDGCAEVIKYAVLFDSELFSHLEEKKENFDLQWVVTRCVSWKRNVVMEDEFDRGTRQKLNLGHTVGHGVEAASNFTISHGQAVAIGMAIVTRACHCPQGKRILDLLKDFLLPTSTLFSADVLYSYILSDKKRSGNTIHVILPMDIGNCIIHPVPIENLKPFLEEGL